VLVGSLLQLALAVTNGLIATVPDRLDATFLSEEVQAEPRTATVTVQLDPADFVDEPTWLQITSRQGDGLVVTPRERTGEGAYLSAVGGEVPSAEIDAGIEIYSAASVRAGLAEFSRAHVEPPSRLRLYRATAHERFVLDAGDRRVNVPMP
jgi:hypothetical protein